MTTVEILLATYNGGRFIEEQLDSYVAQSFGDWSLLVRDDGSTDDTVERIQRHAQTHGYPLRFTSDSGTREGYPGTFFTLVEQSRSELLFFSDQDDVWDREKVATFVAALRGFPASRPALVHSDLTVVDERLNVLHPSFLRSLKAHPPRSQTVLGLFNGLYVTGGATAFNAAVRGVLRRPNVRIGHDAWTAMTCAALGSVRYLDTPSVLYRQHSANVVGAGARVAGQVTSWWKLSAAEKLARNAAPLVTARGFLALYRDVLSPEALDDVTRFATLDQRGPGEVRWLYERGALPSHPEVARRVAAVLLKMQLKHRLLDAESRARSLLGG